MPHCITPRIVFCCLAFLMVSAGRSQAGSQSQSAKKEASRDQSRLVIESLAQRYKDLGSWEASFMQIEKSPGLAQPISSQGKFRFVMPNSFVLQTEGSLSKTFVSEGDFAKRAKPPRKAVAWYMEDNHQAKDRYFVRKISNPTTLEFEKFLVFFRGLKKGQASFKDFEVTGKFNQPELEVTLVPKGESDFAEIKILFHNSEKFPKRLTFIDAVNGETVLNIIDTQHVRKADPKWFEFTPPPGAKVTEG